jgi:hypothetical protein
MVAIPMQVFRDLSDIAAKRNMSFGQFLRAAVNEYLQKTGSPTLLVEEK